ncbi:hypothetical protein PsalN5692_03841 (plasmid) [Piscirickettsia salmonis]|uniref:hypothetical protein n=2 Tax=Piscirickettsia salmonis TaxID=1238 RepID=UPI0012B9AFCA|nr:hypothetical protein [Piscirickettsia salmonis]QGP52333.1 hypothetical protein PsalN5692_03841 [Piscirickettsia salmonis]
MPRANQQKAEPWYDGKALPASGNFIVHRFIPENTAHHGFFEVNFTKGKTVRIHLAQQVMSSGPFSPAKLCLGSGFYPLKQYRFIDPNAADNFTSSEADHSSDEEGSWEGTPEPDYREETPEPVVLLARKDDALGIESPMGIGCIFRKIRYNQDYEEWQKFHRKRVQGRFESVESSKYPFIYSVNKIAKEYSQNKAFCNFRPGQEDEAREVMFRGWGEVSFEIPTDAVNCNTFTQDVTEDLQAQSENFKKSITVCGELGFDLSTTGKLLEEHPQLQEAFLELEINPSLREAFFLAEKEETLSDHWMEIRDNLQLKPPLKDAAIAAKNAGILSEYWRELKESEDPFLFVQKKAIELAIDAVIDNTKSSNKKAIGRFLKQKLQDTRSDPISIYNNLVRMASHVRWGFLGKRLRLKDDNLPLGFDKAQNQIKLARVTLGISQEDHNKTLTERPKHANSPQYQTYGFFCSQMKGGEVPDHTPLMPVP